MLLCTPTTDQVTIAPVRVRSLRKRVPRKRPPQGYLDRPKNNLIVKSSSEPLGSYSSQFFIPPSLALVAGASLFTAARSGFKRLFRRGRRTNRSVAKMVEGNVAQFSVATFNLRGIMDRYAERKSVLKECLKEMDADVLCFQECLTGEYGQDRKLLDTSYHVFPCKAALFNLLSSGSTWLKWYAKGVLNMLEMRPIQRLMLSLPEPMESFREKFRLQGTFFRTLRDLTIAPFFGNSVACRLVDAHEIVHSTLVLGDWRAAQRIEFELKEEQVDDDQSPSHHAVPPSPHSSIDGGPTPRFKFWVVNTHLDHEHPDNRQRQAQEVIDWMEPAKSDCAAVVLCGDFNGNPDEPFHQLLKSKGYKSGYSLRHGKEPEGTWPTGIEAPCKDEGPFECLDYVYIWVGNGYNLQVTDANVYGDRPDEKDPTLYASDHAAIKVSLRIEKVEEGSDAAKLLKGELKSNAELGPLPPEIAAAL